jgi:hypothetical protein
MEDNELSEILARARSAGPRLDTARAELAFETRMQAVARGTAQAPGPESRFHTWLRAVVGLATVAGVMMFLFLTGRGEVDSADTLTAFWTDNGSVWDLQLFD